MSIRDTLMAQVGQKFSIEGVTPAIPETGFVKVSEFIEGMWNKIFPATFDLRWNVDEGKYRGTFPKRVSAWLMDEYGIKMGDDKKERLGNIAKSACFQRSSYIFDFTPDLDWKAGDFGDEKSCYWNEKRFARSLLSHSGCMAIRFFEKDGNGWGRAWLMFPNWENDIDILFVANAYPKTFGLEQAAIVLEKHLSYTYQACIMVNEGSWKDTLWINNGRAIIMFPKGAKPPETNGKSKSGNTICQAYDLTLGKTIKCKCGKVMGVESVCYLIDVPMCGKCLEALTDKCHCCGVREIKTDMKKVMAFRGDVFLCKKCFSEHAKPCQRCGVSNYGPELVSVGPKEICSACFAVDYVHCIRCNKTVRKDNARDGCCNSCYEHMHPHCIKCSNPTQRSYRNSFNGGFVCDECNARLDRCRVCDKTKDACVCNKPGEFRWKIAFSEEA